MIHSKNLIYKKILLSTVLIGSTVLASEIGINLGKSHFDITQSNGDNIILGDNTPKSNGTFSELYMMNKCQLINDNSIKNYASIAYNKSDRIKNYMVLAGLVKEYEAKNYTPYAGVLVGYGQLKYEYNPLNSSTIDDRKASSFIAGFQGGAKYKIDKNLFFNLNAKYLLSDYTTNLESSGVIGNIKHKALTTFSIGVAYKF